MDDSFNLASYLVNRALKTLDFRDARLIFAHTTSSEREPLKSDLYALQSAFQVKYPTEPISIDGEYYDVFFLDYLHVFSCESPLAPHDTRFYLTIAKRKAQETKHQMH